MDPADVQRFALLLMLFGATLELSDAMRPVSREYGYPLVWFALLVGTVGFLASFARDGEE